MKRVGCLFEKTFSEKSLHRAYIDARRGKRKKRSCFEFELSLGTHIRRLSKALLAGTYAPAPYFKFTVHEPKPRLIRAPAFRDTVVQHAIYREIYPIFNRSFISTSFACRKGCGTHRASDYTQRALRACAPELYILKTDIRKFFYSIDREILRNLVERKIKDRRFVEAMMQFAEMDEPVGIPIGNLLSQIYALIYLNPLDHYVKRELKVRHYARYVDDCVLIGLSRQHCLECRERMRQFLASELLLELSKTSIQKIKKGVNFVGYRTWRSRRFIRKYSLHKFHRKVRGGNAPSVVSMLGHAKHTDSLRYMLGIVRTSNPSLLNDLPRFYRMEATHADRNTGPGSRGLRHAS